jgi:diacylglycerol kinase (ATP)
MKVVGRDQQRILLPSSAHMRVAAILGLDCSPKLLRPFQAENAQHGQKIDWRLGMPASHDDADLILLFGGDGTIHRHLSQLVTLGLPVLVVPAGSGNDLARSLGLRSIKDSLAAWRRFCGGKGSVRSIDLGVITPVNQEDHDSAIGSREPALRAHESGFASRYFCCVAGVGLDSEVARRANQLPRWLRGHGGYALSLAPKIFTFAPFPMKISTSEDNSGWTLRSDQATTLAAFANAPIYGGGMKIAPQAKMDDGLIDVCVIGGIDPFRLFCLFPTVYSGGHLKIKEVSYFTAPRVRVETEHPLDVYADGEFVCRTPVEIGMQAAALRVITGTSFALQSPHSKEQS